MPQAEQVPQGCGKLPICLRLYIEFMQPLWRLWRLWRTAPTHSGLRRRKISELVDITRKCLRLWEFSPTTKQNLLPYPTADKEILAQVEQLAQGLGKLSYKVYAVGKFMQPLCHLCQSFHPRAIQRSPTREKNLGVVDITR